MAFSLSHGINPSTNGGRLTLSSTEPVPTSDITAAGTLYWLPYKSDKIALFVTGLGWAVFTVPAAGVSLALTLTAAQNYDVFGFAGPGGLNLEVLAWSSHGAGTSTRATSIARQNGVQIKNGDPTRRFLGTIRSSGSNVCEDSNANRYVWNAENKVVRTSRTQDSTASWTPSNSVAAMNFGSASWIHNFVIGDYEQVYCLTVVAGGDASGDAAACGVALDTAASVHGDAYADQQILSAVSSTLAGELDTIVAPGFHYLQGVEFTAGGTGITFAAGTGSPTAKMISQAAR